jgi:hypothetical protein
MTDDLTGVFDQHDQNIECAIAQCERYAIPLDLPRCGR